MINFCISSYFSELGIFVDSSLFCSFPSRFHIFSGSCIDVTAVSLGILVGAEQWKQGLSLTPLPTGATLLLLVASAALDVTVCACLVVACYLCLADVRVLGDLLSSEGREERIWGRREV